MGCVVVEEGGGIGVVIVVFVEGDYGGWWWFWIVGVVGGGFVRVVLWLFFDGVFEKVLVGELVFVYFGCGFEVVVGFY